MQTPVNSSSHARPLIDGAIAHAGTLRIAAADDQPAAHADHHLGRDLGEPCVGADALTAVVTANLFSQMMMGAANGLGSACGVAIGQSLGAGDLKSVTRVVGTTITSSSAWR